MVRMRIPLRTKFITSSLAVIIICGLAITVVGIHLIADGIVSQVQEKVRTDLNAARHIYRDEIEEVRNIVRLTSLRFFIRNAILENDIKKLEMELDAIRKRESLDILNLTDASGRVIVRSRNPSICGDSQAGDDLLKLVLSNRETVASTAVVPAEELIKEGQDLVERAHIRFITTPKARPKPEIEETSGMVMKAAAPILGDDGNLIGVLYGGRLLNRGYKVVDKVKEIVYQGITYKGKDIGTATIFQEDLRISTNVKREDGERAIGTRVSGEVYDQVLVKGLPWIDKAFVVNSWYIAAYEPIKDIEAKIIGILYVGILEEKFMDMRKRTVSVFLGITLAGMIMASIVSYFLARGVLRPVKDLVHASRQLTKGNLDYQIEIKSNDEVGELGKMFNIMASSLRERNEQLKEYTQQQIMRSERLATLGQLAAGIAHEINNPLGAILMYAHLVLEEMKKKDPSRENLEKVVRETTRCRDIVKGLLDFARQSEPKVNKLDVNEILERALSMVENQAVFHDVKITRVFSFTLPRVMIDGAQMQQVFTNIILNAAEAMNGRGKLTVVSRVGPGGDFVEIEFTDTGCGIPQENLHRLFDPFFTTKEAGQGTGLGLAVSYGIVMKHKGNIDVRSEPGRETTFIVSLPVGAKEKIDVAQR